MGSDPHFIARLRDIYRREQAFYEGGAPAVPSFPPLPPSSPASPPSALRRLMAIRRMAGAPIDPDEAIKVDQRSALADRQRRSNN